MKNFKIAMILVAVVALFSSCTKEGPSITFSEKEGIATYDISKADFCILNLDGTVTAEAGIDSLTYTRTTKDEKGDVKETVKFIGDFAGKTQASLELTDTIFKANLASGYTVVYDVQVVDKKGQTDSKSLTIAITATATPLPTAWNATKVVLCSQSQSSYGITYEGIGATVENETIGVKCLGKNDHKAYNMYAEPTTGASWVFVENIDNLTTNEALVEAYNNGTPVTSRTMFPATDQGKAYEEKYFISKNNNGEYVLVDYVAGLMNTQTGNVMVFQYKKAETATPAAK